MSLFLIFFNPLIIQELRMQNLDFDQKNKPLQAFKSIFTTEGLKPLYKGLPSLFTGALFLGGSVGVASSLWESEIKEN